MSEGTRTPDRLDHNQELYQLSYAHQGDPRIYQCVADFALGPSAAGRDPGVSGGGGAGTVAA